jgi:hypothetical protein
MFNFKKKEKKEPKDLKEVLEQFKVLEQDFKELSLKFKELQESQKLSIQKTGIVRFNPFAEVGGDQSFSLALLDANDNGLVVTSFYTRQENRVYGKPIKKGNSRYVLSREEIKAIKLAQKNNNKDEKSE